MQTVYYKATPVSATVLWHKLEKTKEK